MTLLTQKEPLLYNYTAEFARLGAQRSSPDVIAAQIRIGDSCLLRIGSCREFIWVSVTAINGTILTGTVTTKHFANQWHTRHGDSILFASENVLEIKAV